jgi:hypothetical protein
MQKPERSVDSRVREERSQRDTVRGKVLKTHALGETGHPGVGLESGQPWTDEKGKGLLIREPINTATLPLFFIQPSFNPNFARLNS